MNPADVSLYLVGFMGTGKTTVGRCVAHRLGFRVVDTDHEVEKLAGKTVPEIFAQDGEPAFRKLERVVIEKSVPDSRLVVACGGGLVIQEGMLELLKERGVVVCLHASVETILARTIRSGRNRPLLDVEDPETRARTLYAEREPVYRAAGTVIVTDGRSLSEIAGHVARVWRREATEFARARP